jgi:malate dehydrogenase (oxaloacetate-decarboxylating) (NADP(+))
LDTIGPVILGLSKSIHICTLGSTAEEMVNLATLAVIDAQNK